VAENNQTSLPVVLRSAALAEIESAYRWYERERFGLGEEFLEVVNNMKAVIAADPDRFPVVHRDIRRAVLGRFPYSIFYRVKAQHVIVISCFHSRRNPKLWRSRR
jgi:plasmid stabilization system protein ParE